MELRKSGKGSSRKPGSHHKGTKDTKRKLGFNPQSGIRNHQYGTQEIRKGSKPQAGISPQRHKGHKAQAGLQSAIRNPQSAIKPRTTRTTRKGFQSAIRNRSLNVEL
jgi:hypothetical protein